MWKRECQYLRNRELVPSSEIVTYIVTGTLLDLESDAAIVGWVILYYGLWASASSSDFFWKDSQAGVLQRFFFATAPLQAGFELQRPPFGVL